MNKTKDLIFIGIYVAMAVVLDYASALIPFLQMPQGGSINLALIPVFVASYQLGWEKGVLTGFLWWLVGFLMGGNNYFVDPMQYLLDYIIPAIICGFASWFPKIGKISNVDLGMISTMMLKYICHLLSGVYYWPPEGAARGSLASWTYSLGYNFSYNLVTLLIALIVVPLLISRLYKHQKFVGIK